MPVHTDLVRKEFRQTDFDFPRKRIKRNVVLLPLREKNFQQSPFRRCSLLSRWDLKQSPVGDFPVLKPHQAGCSVHLEKRSAWKMKICKIFVAGNAEVPFQFSGGVHVQDNLCCGWGVKVQSPQALEGKELPQHAGTLGGAQAGHRRSWELSLGSGNACTWGMAMARLDWDQVGI